MFQVAEILQRCGSKNISLKVFFKRVLNFHCVYSNATRFSFASACNLLTEVQDLNEEQSQIAHGETVRETANMISLWRMSSEFEMICILAKATPI